MIPKTEKIDFFREKLKEAERNGFFDSDRAALFGCNVYAVILRDLLAELGIKTIAILDNDINKQNKRHMHLPICDPMQFVKKYSAINIVICSNYYNSMVTQLKEGGVDVENRVLVIPVEIPRKEEEAVAESWGYITEGYKEYLNIIENTGKKDMLLFPYKGTGDIYMACSFLEEYIKKTGMEQYFFVVNGSGCKKVIELFGYNADIFVLDDEKIRSILEAWTFLGNDFMCVKPLIHWGWRFKNTPYVFENPDMSFTDMYRYDVFGLDDSSMPKHPPVNKSSDFARRLFEENSLIKGKTVIVAPYANSIRTNISMTLWSNMVMELRRKGYSVATNCFGDEQPIDGSVGISFPYCEAINVLEYAGGFIALRNGLCDIVSQADCKMVVFYEDNVRSTSYSHFGLKKMGVRDEEYAIMFEKDEDINRVFEVFF